MEFLEVDMTGKVILAIHFPALSDMYRYKCYKVSIVLFLMDNVKMISITLVQIFQYNFMAFKYVHSWEEGIKMQLLL